MVNAEKHKKLRKKNYIDIYIPGPFESWLKDFFFNDKESFQIYWGGINGAINRKINNWNPKNESWFLYDDVWYAESNYEVMSPTTTYAFAGSNSRNNMLWYNSYNFLKNIDIDVLFIDAKDYFCSNFDFFKIFDDVKNYDLLFIKNVTMSLHKLLLEYGIKECINYVYFFIPEAEDLSAVSETSKEGLYTLNKEDEFLYEKNDAIGLDLYLNLVEWKKEVKAATRNDPEYRKMKRRVHQRDNNTCQCCGYYNNQKKNHNLEVHHIYGYKDHLDYRVEDSNCVLLCKDCHKQYHTIYGKKDVNPVSFMQFIRDYNDFHQKDVQSKLM